MLTLLEFPADEVNVLLSNRSSPPFAATEASMMFVKLLVNAEEVIRTEFADPVRDPANHQFVLPLVEKVAPDVDKRHAETDVPAAKYSCAALPPTIVVADPNMN